MHIKIVDRPLTCVLSAVFLPTINSSRLMKLGMLSPFRLALQMIDHLRHLLALVLEAGTDNPLFRSPVGNNPKHILDLGTGKGNWAMYVNPKVLSASLVLVRYLQSQRCGGHVSQW